MRTAIVIVAMAIGGPCFAATPVVYKCAGSNGTVVFSQAPCGKDAKQVDTSGALRTGTSPNVQGVSDYAALGRIDSDCRIQADLLARRYQADVAEVDAQVSRLRASMRYSSNNLAGATRDSGIQTQIAALTERRSALQDMERNERRDLDVRCTERRAAETKAQADRAEAARSAQAAVD